MRWAMFAERVGPELQHATEIAAQDPDGIDPKQRPSFNRARVEAAKARDEMRAVLFPPDEPD